MRIGGFQPFEFDAEHDVGAQFGDIRFWQIGIGEYEDVGAGLRDLLFLIADNVLAAAPVRLEGRAHAVKGETRHQRGVARRSADAGNHCLAI